MIVFDEIWSMVDSPYTVSAKKRWLQKSWDLQLLDQIQDWKLLKIT